MKTLSFFLLFSIISHSQNCRFELNTTDAVSGHKKVLTQEQAMATTKIAGLYFSLENNDGITLDVRYTVASTTPVTVGFSNKLALYLSNDEVMELPLANVISGESNLTNNLTINPKYKITVEQIEKIKSTGLKKVRMNTSQYYFDFDIKRKGWLQRFSTDADCFLKEVR